MNVIIPCVGCAVDPLAPMPSGKVLLEHVIGALPHVDMVITIAHPSQMISQEMINPYAWYPVNIKRKPMGILDTLLEARALLNNNDELLINYSNCYLPDNQMQEFIHEMRQKDRWSGVVCFNSNNPLFSREPANKFAMAGLIYFKHAKQFLKMAQGYKDDKFIDPGHLAFAVTGFLGLNKASAFVTDNIVYLKTQTMYEMYCRLQKAKASEALAAFDGLSE